MCMHIHVCVYNTRLYPYSHLCIIHIHKKYIFYVYIKNIHICIHKCIHVYIKYIHICMYIYTHQLTYNVTKIMTYLVCVRAKSLQ